MKNTLRVLSVLILMVMLLTACSTPATTEVNDVKLNLEEVNLVILKADGTYLSYQVEEDSLSEKTADGLINYVAHKHTLTYTIDGTLVTKIADLVPEETDNGGTFISPFTSNVDEQMADAYAKTINLGNITVVSAGKGVTELTVANGTVIYIQLETYTF